MCFFRKKKNEEEKKAEEVFSTYLDFPHHSGEIDAYLATSIGLITIRLKDGTHIHYYPKDMQSFINWLDENKIRDVRKPIILR